MNPRRTSSTYSALTLKSKVSLLGEGPASTLKVIDNPGNYFAVLTSSSSSVLQDVRISRLRIDQNPSNNPTSNIDTANPPPGGNYYQFAVISYNYENIVIEDVRFDPCCGVNAVSFNNVACRGATVSQCYFRFVRAAGSPTYDNTSIYINGWNHTVVDNQFYSDVTTAKALGAIETHTGQSTIANNVTEGFSTGLNLQASSQTMSNCDMTVTGNTFSQANQGIQLWALGNYPIKNVTISGNTIRVDGAAHNRSTTAGICSAGSSSDTGNFENLTITGNTIVFKEETVYRSNLFESSAFGIGLTKPVAMSNILISNNVIINAPITGIHMGCPLSGKISTLTNVGITGNVIVNAGHYPGVAESYRAGILLRNTVSNAYVTDNSIIDTYPESKLLYSIKLNDSEGTYSEVEVKDNFIRANQGGMWLDLSPSVMRREGRRS
ncbi:hypothetical protein N6H14_28645 [Paenibacillus sp. CC-CFT747]|nr:hypothetical protein N6H14_28645 [Paenibacillus sp. CC-CFT747]